MIEMPDASLLQSVTRRQYMQYLHVIYIGAGKQMGATSPDHNHTPSAAAIVDTASKIKCIYTYFEFRCRAAAVEYLSLSLFHRMHTHTHTHTNVVV